MTKSTAQVLSGLCDHFMVIYGACNHTQTPALAKKMLEEDIRQLGLYFGTVDEFGQLAELTLVAECIAHIRTFDSGLDQSKQIDYWTDIIMGELQDVYFNRPLADVTMQDIVASMQTWRLAKELFETERITDDIVETLRHSYLELADMFFMRDGNISSEEMVAMRELEAALALS